MEEFTFPCVPLEQSSTNTLPFPHLASPSPWLVAGSVVHEHDHHRRSFSAVEPQAAACSDHYTYTVTVAGGGGYQHHGSARYAAEDRMDMLWEDFNEELTRAAPPCPLTEGTPWMTTTKETWLAGEDDDCAPAETRKRAVVRWKRIGLLAMLRLLKKLFLAHKSRRPEEAIGKSSL